MRLESAEGELVFQSHPGAQTTFTDYSGRYALTGGSAGGGKSECLLFLPFRQIEAEKKRILDGTLDQSIGRAIFFRRTMPEVQEMIDRARLSFPKLDPGAKWLEQQKTWTFSCGYKYKFGQMEEAKDWIKYYGTQYTYVAFDELTTFTEEQFDMLDTRIRSPDPELAKMLWMRAGTNPVGIGLRWVKKRFVSCGPPNVEIVKKVSVPVTKNGVRTTATVERRQIFIPARLSDNPSIDQAEYAATLSTKSDQVRRALLEGDWGSMTGDLLGTVWDEAAHIVKPFELPTARYKFRTCHYTYADTVVIWWCVDVQGNLTAYRELNLKDHTADMVAGRIMELEKDAKEWTEGSKRTNSRLIGFLGPKESCWTKTGQVGPTVAETMGDAGVTWFRCDNNPAAATEQIRHRLAMRTKHPTKKDVNGEPVMVPGVRWFKTCDICIETIPTLQADKTDPDQPDPKSPDRTAFLALAYATMSRPVTPSAKQEEDDLGLPKTKKKTAARMGSHSNYPGMR